MEEPNSHGLNLGKKPNDMGSACGNSSTPTSKAIIF